MFPIQIGCLSGAKNILNIYFQYRIILFRRYQVYVSHTERGCPSSTECIDLLHGVLHMVLGWLVTYVGHAHLQSVAPALCTGFDPDAPLYREPGLSQV